MQTVPPPNAGQPFPLGARLHAMFQAEELLALELEPEPTLKIDAPVLLPDKRTGVVVFVDTLKFRVRPYLDGPEEQLALASFRPAFTREETIKLRATLTRMRTVNELYYEQAFAIGNHAFIEFCGIQGEYIKACEEAFKHGMDFTECSIHSGKALAMRDYQKKYLAEKIECIYGLSFPELYKAIQQ
jgi:hypothetical protein